MPLRRFVWMPVVLVLLPFSVRAFPAPYVQSPRFPITSGTIGSLTSLGNTVYLAGEFRWIAPPHRGLSAVDSATSLPHPSFPDAAGSVYAIAPLPDGGWIIGGYFSTVGGVPRRNLARLRADGSVDPWNPSPDRAVHALFVERHTLFVGGQFDTISGQPRARVSSFDLRDGALDGWRPIVSGDVFALWASATHIYVGGGFRVAGGSGRENLAAFDRSTGELLDWNPRPNSTVLTMALSSSGRLWIGGNFEFIDTSPQAFLARLDTASAAVVGAGPSLDLPVLGLLEDAGRMWVCGQFRRVGSSPTRALALLDEATGAPVPFDASVEGTVRTLCRDGSTLVLGGDFRTVGGEARENLARVEVATARPAAWNPGASHRVHALARSGRTMLVGGGFTSVGLTYRRDFAAVEGATGRVLPWTITVDGAVRSIAAAPGAVYLGGGFNQVNGAARSGLAAVHPTTGEVSDWNPSVEGSVNELIPSDSAVFVHGNIYGFNGVERRYLGFLDRSTGSLLPWDPRPDSILYTAAILDSVVYLSGVFEHVEGEARGGLAAVGIRSGQLLPWAPNLNGWIGYLYPESAAVHAGGGARSLNGVPNVLFARLDSDSGKSLSWSVPLSYPPVRVASLGESLVVAGSFVVLVNGNFVHNLIGVRRADGAPFVWASGSATPLRDMTSTSSGIIVGGPTNTDPIYPAAGFQRFVPADTTRPSIRIHEPREGEIRRVRSVTEIRWDASDDRAARFVDLYWKRANSSDLRELIASSLPARGSYSWTTPEDTNGDPIVVIAEVQDDAGNVSTSGSGEIWIGSEEGPRAGTATGSPISLGRLSPSPTGSDAAVGFAVARATRVRFTLHDLSGRLIRVVADRDFATGGHVVTVRTASLRSGLYFLRATTADGSETRRVVVTR